MSLEAALFAYSGLAGLALGTHQHRRTPLPGVGSVRPVTARLVGTSLIVASLFVAVANFGGPQGVVVWIELVSVAGLCLVLLLSRWPRRTFRIVPAIVVLALAILVARAPSQFSA